MIARNVTSSAATALGYGLAVSRAVGRNSRALRIARLAEQPVRLVLGAAIDPADLRTLARAGLVDLTTSGRSIAAYQLTDAGRTLAARL